MSESLFGTDGVRGEVGVEPITPQTLLKLGWAAGSVFAEHGGHGKVIIGKDTRVSGYLLESALEAGFSAAGVDISLLGPMPTPGIAYLTRTARALAGIVISASHNAYHDNGVKFFSAGGYKLDERILKQIEQKMQQPMVCVDSRALGKAERFSDAAGRYIEFCKGTLPNQLSLGGLKVVVDCANGAAYHIAPEVLTELGAEVVVIGNQPDGFNINLGSGSTQPQTLQDKVREEGAQVGIALDGDADRVIMVDEQGNLVDGDQILYVLSMHRKAKQLLGGGVAGTVMTNLGLELAFRQQAIPFIRTRVGDRYILEVLNNKNWLLGGEASGHIICLDKNTTGDAIVAALEALQVMIETDKPLSTLVNGMEIYPQKIINVPLGKISGKEIVSHPQVIENVREVEQQLGELGRVVLRPSGTEPLLRVMIEGEEVAEVEKLTRALADSVKAVVS